MIPPFDFAAPGRIVFGSGRLPEIGPLVRVLGRRAFLVTGADPARGAACRGFLQEAGVSCATFAVAGEPTTDLAAEAAEAARSAGCDCVVALGGGSVIDAGKAVAALLTNPGDLYEHLEVVGRGRPLLVAPVPCAALPTTAGAGAEATRNAVLRCPRAGVKASLRDPRLLPAVALVDPALTLGLPPAITAATGLDALTQLVEPFVCTRATPLTDGFCREGLARVARSLGRAWADGADLRAREDMSLASLLGGLSLAGAGLGAAHGLAAPLGGACRAPHGAVCGALLAPVWRANLLALRARAPGSPALERYREAAVLLTGDPAAMPEDGAAWVAGLAARLGVPGIAAHGVTEDLVPGLARKGLAASSMKANPVPLTEEELAAVLRAAR